MKNSPMAWMLAIAGCLRYYFLTLESTKSIGQRLEFTTPLNSFKRAMEGVNFQMHGINPYAGDMVHESPMLLLFIKKAVEVLPTLLPVFYILIDLLTGVILYHMSKNFVRKKLVTEKGDTNMYAPGSASIQLQKDDLTSIPNMVLMLYLFNPLLIFNCVGLTSTVFSNFLLALVFYFLTAELLVPCLLCLAIESLRNLYPIVLIAPVVLIFGRRSLLATIGVMVVFWSFLFGVAWLNYLIVGSWNYLNETIGFIFFYRDLKPNIGLFWYFFTEMFEHFRAMFLVTFQINAIILYLIPLSLKLRKEPMLLATILIALMAIFRSYPCLGDVGFYLTLLPLWSRCSRFMAHSFVVFCYFLITLGMLPALWHLWIYAGSANANFYFGTTLAFSTGQIFLVTDLLFAYVKREFCLYNGQRIFIDGKEAKILLE